MIKAMAGPHRTNNRNVLLKAAAAIVWSHLAYGLELFGHNLDDAIESLGPVYNRSIRTACGLLPSTPADAACAEAGLLPFGYYITDMLCRRAIGLDAKTTGRTKVCLLQEGIRAFRSKTHIVFPPVARVHWVGAKKWDLRVLKIEPRIQDNFRADGLSKKHVSQNYQYRQLSRGQYPKEFLSKPLLPLHRRLKDRHWGRIWSSRRKP